MAIGTITMLLTNVGLQIYNNWCGSRQNDKLQKKREEFERAARDRNTEHMWKLLREGQELTLELEHQKHGDRLEELKKEVDDLLRKLTYEATINNWPLKVLPIVMKNQAFGNLLAKQEEHVAMHVIFTRSNYDNFNKLIYPIVEKKLEQYCDKHWSTMTDHPVLFYSGAWRPLSNPTDVQVTAMREELKNLPTLLITPFFRPNDGKLVFQVHMWGVGANSTDRFDVPEIEPLDFQRSFSNNDDYDKERGLFEEIVEDLVPYLECMIGYMADTYFWSSAGLAPHLPMLVTNGSINTDGMKYIVDDCREYYDKLLLKSEENAKENPFMQQNLLKLYEGSAELWDEETKRNKKEECILSSAYSITGNSYLKINDLYSEGTILSLNLDAIDSIIKLLKSYGYLNEVNYITSLKNKKISNKNNEITFEKEILTSSEISKLETLACKGRNAASFRLGELYEFSIGCDFNMEKAIDYYENAASNNYVLAIFKTELLHFILESRCDYNIIKLYAQELKKLSELGIYQAIILIVAFSYYNIYNFINSDELLTTLDLAEDSNHPYAYYLGALIIKGKYGAKYGDKVIALLTKSAEIGSTQAILELANIYYEGKITKKSIKRYLELNKQAAEYGASEALVNIGYCYAIGDGVIKSKSKAFNFFKMAAELGNKDALELLSKI